MKTLPLCVLAYEGPQCRAYLSRMRAAGLRPARILLVVLARHPATRAPVGAWLPGFLRVPYARRAQEHAQNYWPRRIRAERPGLFAAVSRALSALAPDAGADLARMAGRFDYADYADQVETVLADGLNDPRVRDALSRVPERTVLFTGGGILKAALLGLPDKRFLHVHPGTLPHVKGADGMLWSLLVRGVPGFSCFWMNPGLDTGPIVHAEDSPRLEIELPPGERPDDLTLYRALFSYCDPLLRADFLVRNILIPYADRLEALPSAPQHADQGLTYAFMHPALRSRALRILFSSTTSTR
jgi:hypothetical protein